MPDTKPTPEEPIVPVDQPEAMTMEEPPAPGGGIPPIEPARH